MEQLCVLDEREYPEWDRAVLASDRGTLFHTTTWVRAWDVPCRVYAIRRGEKLLGGFIAPYREPRVGGRVSLRPPFTPYSGQMFFSPSRKPSTAHSEMKRASSLTAASLQSDFESVSVRLGTAETDIQPFLWAGFTADVRYTYLVDVSDLSKAWSALSESRRRNVNAATKLGLSVLPGLDLDVAASLFRATRNHPDRWKASLRRCHAALKLSDQAEVFGVYGKNGDLLGAIYLVWDRFRSYYLLGGYRQEEQDEELLAMSFGLWEMMQFTKLKLELPEMDLEGSMIPGVELFFRKFGGRLVPFYRISWTTNRNRARQMLARIVDRTRSLYTTPCLD